VAILEQEIARRDPGFAKPLIVLAAKRRYRNPTARQGPETNFCRTNGSQSATAAACPAGKTCGRARVWRQ
jgi:hypothetical protein